MTDNEKQAFMELQDLCRKFNLTLAVEGDKINFRFYNQGGSPTYREYYADYFGARINKIQNITEEELPCPV